MGCYRLATKSLGVNKSDSVLKCSKCGVKIPKQFPFIMTQGRTGVHTENDAPSFHLCIRCLHELTVSVIESIGEEEYT